MKTIITLLFLIFGFVQTNAQTWMPKAQPVPYDLTHSSVYLKSIDKHIKFAYRSDKLEAWEYDYYANYMYYIGAHPIIYSTYKDNISACRIGDDKILVCVANKYFDFKDNMFVFDYRKKTFENILTIDEIYPPKLDNYSLTYIGDDKAMLFGGEDSLSFCRNNVWIFDLSDCKWTNQVIDSIHSPEPRMKHAATYWEPNKVIIHGGNKKISILSESTLSDTWMYDLSNNKWDLVPSGKIQPAFTKAQNLINIDNKKALLFGTPIYKTKDTLYSFDFNKKEWEAIYFKDMFMGNSYKFAELLTPSKIYINNSNKQLIYDIDSNKFALCTQPNNATNVPFFSHAMCSIGDSSIICHGGVSTERGDNYNNPYIFLYTEPTWILDFRTYTWKPLTPEGDRPWCLKEHAISNIGDDKVVLFGGINYTKYTNETWFFDLSDNAWTKQNPSVSPSARSRHSMCYIGDDKVLLFGGYYTKRMNDTWLYDLSENTWTLITPANGTKPTTRYGQAMCYIGDSKVLLFGGFDGAANSDTWIFDLHDNSWTLKIPKGGTMPSARYFHSLTYLEGDNAILFGGRTGSGSNKEAWNYDLSMNTWTLLTNDSLPRPRYAHAMAGVNGKAVLFSGIVDSNDVDYTTWVFEYSNPTGIDVTPTEANISVFPTPANESITFEFIASEGDCTVEFYDLSGRIVKTEKLGLIHKGNNSITVSTSDFIPGAYLVSIITETGTLKGKIQIVR